MVGLLSDIGNSRSLNEDFIDFRINDKYKLFVVADGMGGHNAGEVASKMAVEQIIKYVEEHFEEISYESLIIQAFKEANKVIFEASLKNKSLYGMGTTVTACLIIGSFIYIANVGDSSCYLIGENTIKKVTKDHSLVQKLLDEGSITEEEAFHHPNKNIITRAVGTSREVDVDLFDLADEKYKYLLLCTDGLSDELKMEDIFEVISSSKGLNESCQNLVSLAKSRGGKDNISVLIVGGAV